MEVMKRCIIVLVMKRCTTTVLCSCLVSGFYRTLEQWCLARVSLELRLCIVDFKSGQMPSKVTRCVKHYVGCRYFAILSSSSCDADCD